MAEAQHAGEALEMTEDFTRQRVLKFLKTFYSGNVEDALSYCSDDIDFVATAPIDIFPHMGHRRGKAQVKEMWDAIHTRYSSMRYEVPIIVVEGDKVAVHISVSFRKSSNDRVVHFDIAAFYALHESKIVQVREIMDTYDLVQQVLERDLPAR